MTCESMGYYDCNYTHIKYSAFSVNTSPLKIEFPCALLQLLKHYHMQTFKSGDHFLITHLFSCERTLTILLRICNVSSYHIYLMVGKSVVQVYVLEFFK